MTPISLALSLCDPKLSRSLSLCAPELSLSLCDPELSLSLSVTASSLSLPPPLVTPSCDPCELFVAEQVSAR